jgi:16S rRNA (cytidine1402-2'-O)-methyltransferase
LVRQAVEAGIHVTVIPGPSAALAALVISALPTDRFLFHGFLPASPSARRKCLHELRQVRSTLVVFESPARLLPTLTDMAAILGPRQAAVSRELTKVFEEVRRGRLDELATHYRRAGSPRGEVVLVIGPPHETDERIEESDLDRRLEAALETMSLRDAATAVAGATGFPRRRIYTRALELAGREPDDR